MKKNKHTGSSLDSFLKEENIYDEVNIRALTKTSFDLIDELYSIINEKSERSELLSRRDKATMKMETFVGTKAQYDEKFTEVLALIEKTESDVSKNKNERVQLKWLEVKSAVEKEESVEKSTKLDKAWLIAWDKGHSAGYSEVVSEFRDLVELIRD